MDVKRTFGILNKPRLILLILDEERGREGKVKGERPREDECLEASERERRRFQGFVREGKADGKVRLTMTQLFMCSAYYLTI